MTRVTLHDKTFEISIPNTQIKEAIKSLAKQISDDYRDKSNPIFMGVLNGAFMFMAELIQEVDIDCEVSFVKLSSYNGISSGCMSELIGVGHNIKGRHVVVVEDIVDTGQSIEHMLKMLVKHEPESIEIATLLFKPAAYKQSIPIKYIAFSIPNDFIVGFGLDYDQLGRNLKDIYKIVNE